MRSTTNYGLKKPESTDVYDVDDFNSNMDKIDTELKRHSTHTDNKSNPHKVTKSQIGLGNVDNTKDIDKPISTAVQAALNLKAKVSDLTAHTTDEENPHKVTASQVGLGNVNNTADIDKPISTAVQNELDKIKQSIVDVDAINEATGSAVILTDTADGSLSDIKVYGRSIQDGTPTPDSPIDIVNVGNGGTLEVKSTGKNSLPYPYLDTTFEKNGLKFTDNGDGSITVNGTATAQTNFHLTNKITVDDDSKGLELKKGQTYILSGCPSGGSSSTYFLYNNYIENGEWKNYGREEGNGLTFVSNGKKPMFIIRVISGATLNNLTFKPMLRLVEIKDDTYEPYKSSSVTIPLSEPLRSVGNVKDEIACIDGVYGVVRRIKSVRLRDLSVGFIEVRDTCTNVRYAISDMNDLGYDALCSHFVQVSSFDYTVGNFRTRAGYNYVYFFMPKSITNENELATWLSTNDVKLDYILAEEVFEPFEDQEIFKNIVTYNNITNLTTTDFADMWVEYYSNSSVGQRLAKTDEEMRAEHRYLQEQITNSQTEIDTIKQTIQDLPKRNFILIGDSYLYGYTPDGTIASWGAYLAQILPQYTFTSYAIQGSGFGSTVSGKNFLDVLKKYDGDKNIITDILVCGGYNDAATSITTGAISNGISAFVTYVKENYPNVKIHIGYIGASSNGAVIEQLKEAIRIYRACGIYGCSYIANMEYVLKNTQFFTSDKVHPNQIGQKNIAWYLASYLTSGNVSVIQEKEKCEVVTPSTVTAGITLYTALNNETATLYHPKNEYLQFTGLSATNMNGAEGSRLTLGTISNSSIIGNQTTDDVTTSTANVAISVPINIATATGWYTGIGTLEVINLNVVLRVNIVNGNTYLNEVITGVIIPPFTLSLDSLDC